MNHTCHLLFTTTILLITPLDINSQDTIRTPHASQYAQVLSRGVAIPYAYYGEGVVQSALFGMDTAWDDESNVRRGTAFIGKEHMGTGRISFQPDYFVSATGELTESQKTALRNRITHIKLSGVTDVQMNCDHEAMATTNYQYKGKPEEWYRVIKASVRYAQSLGVNVVTVAPFNEPDYTGWNEGSKDDFRAICEMLSQDADFTNIRISAGNTLNCDRASEWYNYMKPYVQEGCTHQLAGSFDNYASFFEQVRSDGNYATGDELHNVMEAIVGLEYGMQSGIWWGFDALARGNFCKASSGSGARLGYGENRSAWSAGGVYRLPDGQVNAILGTSERQATNSTYQILSTDGSVYYDGWGPMSAFSIEMPGGTAYQRGQTNAERCIQIVRGVDVPPIAPLEGGNFVIMNKHSKKVIGVQGNSLTVGKNIVQQTYDPSNPQPYHHWHVAPVSSRVGGDFSYAYIRSASDDQLILDVKNWALGSGGQVMLWNGEGGANEQWYFEYAGNGDFYIRSRHSSLCLEVRSSSTMNGGMLQQGAFTGADNQRWRLLPIGTACETDAPAAPEGLTADVRSHSVQLHWNANSDEDLAGYYVLRGEYIPDSSFVWNVIGRDVIGTDFIDNTCSPATYYAYRVRAVDHSGNRSTNSNTITITTTDEKEMVAHYTFNGSIFDSTPNQMDALSVEAPVYQNIQKREGTHSFYMNGTNYIQLPSKVADHTEMTVSAWVYWQGGAAWQRIFDFGNGTDQYLYLTPSNGTLMRLAIKNGSDEQAFSTNRLSTFQWKHIAVTMDANTVTLYVDGEAVAKSDAMTIRPSDFHPVVNLVGCSQFAANPIFKGCIDDFRIYNYALTPDEVTAVMAGTDNLSERSAQKPNIIKSTYLTPGGIQLKTPQPGINIIKDYFDDGQVKSRVKVF